MEIKDMISDVGRARSDLAGLVLDGVTPDRLVPCQAAVDDLETGVTELLTTAWIPRSVPELTAAIYCTRENIRRVQSDIDDALDVNQEPNIFDRAQPDELFRVWMGMTFGRLLEHQLEILMDALALAAPKAEWLN